MLDDEHSTKAMVYTLRQIRIQLEELDKLIDGKPQKVIDDGLNRAEAILATYDKPEAFRDRNILKKDVERLRDDVIEPLSFESIKDYLRIE